MKYVCLICSCLWGMLATAESNRKEAASYQRLFAELPRTNVLTNWNERVISLDDERGRLTFTYDAEGSLSYVRLFGKDGGFECYEYRGGKVCSGLITDPKTKDSVMTLFSEQEMTGKNVDRVVMHRKAGCPFSGERYFTSDGTEIHPPKNVKPSILNIECVPSPGMSVEIGPYKWTELGVDAGLPVQRLAKNEKVLIEGALKVAGKYPWLLGDCAARTGDKLSPELEKAGVKRVHPLKDEVEYYFVIDVRNDDIYYFAKDQRQLIEEKFGLKSEFDKFYYLDELLFDRRATKAKEQRQKLSAALRPPSEETEENEGSGRMKGQSSLIQ